MVCPARPEINLAQFPIPAGYEIRNFEEKDLPAWLELNKCEGLTTRCYDALYKPMLEEFKQNCFLAVEKKDGKVVGSCAYYPAYGGKIATGHWFFVREDLREKGIGEALLSRCMQKVPMGQPVYLTTHAKNFDAIALYLKHGCYFVTQNLNGPKRQRPWGDNFQKAKAFIQEGLKTTERGKEALTNWKEQEMVDPSSFAALKAILTITDRNEL
ncbi:hypothetical protein FACS189481_4620 [Clostridia bacterium]|nr:hypothetical protein FACS189481_4620 [Clostridia bacterium]